MSKSGVSSVGSVIINMEDWGEDLYEYGATGGDDYPFASDEGGDRGPDAGEDEDDMGFGFRGSEGEGDEDDPYRGDPGEERDFGGGDGEDVDFRPDFKQSQQLLGDKGRGTMLAPGASKRIQKVLRTPEEVIRDQLRGILSSDVYSDLSESKKNSIVEQAELIKNVGLLHLETLVHALMWKMENKPLNKKHFGDFAKRYIPVTTAGGSEQVSVVTYIRLITINPQ